MSFWGCKWCGGRGCLSCDVEADRAYKAAFPNGPVPLATFDTTTPEGVAAAQECVGMEALQKAFAPGGGGAAEIALNCQRAKDRGAAT